jgi:hypothetical protein
MRTFLVMIKLVPMAMLELMASIRPIHLSELIDVMAARGASLYWKYASTPGFVTGARTYRSCGGCDAMQALLQAVLAN